MIQAAAKGKGLLPLSCPSNSQQCMTVRDRPMLGENAGYVVFQMPAGFSLGSICGSYVTWDTNAQAWHSISTYCGQPGTVLELGGTARVTVSTCANVRTFPVSGDVITCLPNGSLVGLDEGPVSVGDPSVIWWHERNVGWIAHQLILLVSPSGAPVG